MSEVSRQLRKLVRTRALGHCEYRQTSERVTGLRCQVDHIIPVSQGGATAEENLCLACSACNGHKQARSAGVDPQTGETVALYNPRQHMWRQHFAWSDDGAEIIGLTSTGRATVVALEMNDPLMVTARSLWVGVGVHPPAA
jgi:hypothetical protein